MRMARLLSDLCPECSKAFVRLKNGEVVTATNDFGTFGMLAGYEGSSCVLDDENRIVMVEIKGRVLVKS
jgi:hypothetical protein